MSPRFPLFFLALIFYLILVLHFALSQKPLENIRIGGIFDRDDKVQSLAFQAAVEEINNRHDLLPDSHVVGYVEYISNEDANRLRIKVCKLLSLGALSIFGPSKPFHATYVQSICDDMDIPCIQTRLDMRQRRDRQLVNIHPHYSILIQAYIDIIKEWKWNTFAIVYENINSLMIIQDMILDFSPVQENFMIRKLPEKNFRELLWELKRNNQMNVFLYASSETAHEFLTQAQQVGMLTDRNGYVISSLDFHTLNLEDFKYARANITGVRLINPLNLDVQDAVAYWTAYSGHLVNISAQTLPVEAALMYDAVRMYAKALDKLNRSQRLEETEPLNCDTDVPISWRYGSSLLNQLSTVNYDGISGHVVLNPMRERTDFHLEVVELVSDGVRPLASWNAKQKFTRYETTSVEIRQNDEFGYGVANKTFIVTTILNDPLCMLKESTERLSGNDRYEGFVIDFLDHLARNLSFKYVIQLVRDNQYGKIVNGKWNGMIGEVINGTADMVVADVSVNSDRAHALDFTLPFMNLGISVLYVTPKRAPPSFFSFMAPFSNDVWLYLTVAYVGVSVVLFFVARFSPYEWDNPYPCIEDPDDLVNQFGILNSFWFTIGSLMQQGTELAPKAVSTRMASSIWAFFILIMISSYTANLAAFLTIEKSLPPFSRAAELAHQNKIKYGVVESGSTRKFFENATHEDYMIMWNTMKANPHMSLLKDNNEGMKKVLDMKGEFAFFMESTIIEYRVERNCELYEVGNSWLDNKGYAVGFPKNSKYTKIFNNIILDMQERGDLRRLKNRWWKEKRKSAPCIKVKPNMSLGVPNVAGVFGVVVIGTAIAGVIAIGEFIWVIRCRSKKEQVSFWHLAREELAYILKFQGSTKPLRKKLEEKDSNDRTNSDLHDELVRFSQLPQKSSRNNVS